MKGSLKLILSIHEYGYVFGERKWILVSNFIWLHLMLICASFRTPFVLVNHSTVTQWLPCDVFGKSQRRSILILLTSIAELKDVNESYSRKERFLLPSKDSACLHCGCFYQSTWSLMKQNELSNIFAILSSIFNLFVYSNAIRQLITFKRCFDNMKTSSKREMVSYSVMLWPKYIHFAAGIWSTWHSYRIHFIPISYI